MVWMGDGGLSPSEGVLMRKMIQGLSDLRLGCSIDRIMAPQRGSHTLPYLLNETLQ